MTNPLGSRVSLTVAFVAVLGVATAWTVAGGALFSPGALHAGDPAATRMGGVTSHAELRRDCAACHAPPFAARDMAARCTQCHTDIQAERRDTTSLHGAITATSTCTSCHTEHRGADGTLTDAEGLGGIHERFGFVLDGAHAPLSCARCHTPVEGRVRYADTPTTCVGCHEADDTHRGEFGPDCASCHTTSTWEGATFAHDVFPLDHGARRPSSCETCHTDRTDYTRYTCYGCHAHTPANVRREHEGEVNTTDLEDCVRCHVGGREHGEGGERDRGGRRRRRD